MDTTSTETLQPYEGASCDWYNIPCHASSFADWLFEVMLYIPRKLFQLLTEGLASVIEAIPVPDFFTNASANLGSIPASVMWLADYMALSTALTIFVSAYTLRFLIRRLPLVG